MILPHLGYAFHGGPGYSVHGCYDILVHGISHIRSPAPPGQDPRPIRISLALYPQGNVYSGAARYSATLKGLDRFSDPALWIPFYPKGLVMNDVCESFKAEEKRLYRKYRDEVIAYHLANPKK